MSSSRGAIILTSYFDMHVSIGTSWRFWLLPIPWNTKAFRQTVSDVLTYGVQSLEGLEHPLCPEPLSPQDQEIINRGAGVQAWIKYSTEAPEVMLLLENIRIPRRLRLKAQQYLDALSYHVQPDIMLNSESVPMDQNHMDTIEQQFLMVLQNVYPDMFQLFSQQSLAILLHPGQH